MNACLTTMRRALESVEDARVSWTDRNAKEIFREHNDESYLRNIIKNAWIMLKGYFIIHM